jgi:hypothetical protein
VICPTQRPLPDNTQQSQDNYFRAPAEFEPTIPASERQQTHALDRAANDSPLDLNRLFKVSSSVFITFLNSLFLELFNINQYHLQVTSL